MTRGSVPHRDVELLNWAKSFSQQLSESPESSGISPELAAELAAAVEAYAEALTIATAIGTRTQPAVLVKNEKKDALTNLARSIVKMIDATNTTTDQQRISLGINRRKSRTRVPAPSGRPSLSVRSVVGRRVMIRVYDPMTENFKSKGQHATAVGIYSFIGEHPPTDGNGYHFHGIYTRSTITLDFPHTVPSGAAAWLCARWLNAKGEPGPSCEPRLLTIQGGPAGYMHDSIRPAA